MFDDLKRKIRRLFGNRFSGVVKFIVCGVQKGGTTALDVYLREHSGICMADRKEVHFFDNESAFKNGRKEYSLYHSYFSGYSKGKLVGECTPIYSYWSQAPYRIRDYNPEMKLILILRNPIDRAYSHWNMERSRGNEQLSFADAIRMEADRLSDGGDEARRVFSYIDRGFYTAQLTRLYELFPKDQVLVLKSDDLKMQPGVTLNKVYEFLDLPMQENVVKKNVHARSYKQALQPFERSYLHSIFDEEILAIQQMLGWDCSDWLND